MKRRTFLKTVGASAGVVALAGCTQLSRAIPGCDNMHSTVLDYEAVTLTDEQESHIVPIVYTNLQPAHQQLIEKASGEAKVKVCPTIPDSVESFVTLVKDRIDRQWNEYGGKPEDRPDYLRTAYLKRNGSYFELEVYVEDIVISG